VLGALDPVRVYQAFAQLDLVSHGRAEIIAGRSAFVEPFAPVRAPMNEYGELVSDKLDLLLRLRAEDPITCRALRAAARRRRDRPAPSSSRCRCASASAAHPQAPHAPATSACPCCSATSAARSPTLAAPSISTARPATPPP